MKKLKQTGFTIVEMLLAIALFAILIPAIIVSLNTIAAANDNAKDTVIANIIAENKVEELRGLGYNSLTVETVDFDGELPQTLGAPKDASYTVTEPTTGQKEVTVEINFTSRRGTQTLNYRTIISELGVGQ